MKSRTLLFISLGFIAFHIFGHTMGHFTWKEVNDPVLTQTIREMYSHKFQFMGTDQSLGGHHDGFSILFEILLLTFAALTWYVARAVGTVATTLKPVLLIMALALLACGVVELIYFFPLAGGSSIIAGALQLLVYFREK
jgi:hypothetical protein